MLVRRHAFIGEWRRLTICASNKGMPITGAPEPFANSTEQRRPDFTLITRHETPRFENNLRVIILAERLVPTRFCLSQQRQITSPMRSIRRGHFQIMLELFPIASLDCSSYFWVRGESTGWQEKDTFLDTFKEPYSSYRKSESPFNSYPPHNRRAT